MHHFLSAQPAAALYFLFHSQLPPVLYQILLGVQLMAEAQQILNETLPQLWTCLFPHVHAPSACWQSTQGFSSVKISASSINTKSNLASNA